MCKPKQLSEDREKNFQDDPIGAEIGQYVHESKERIVALEEEIKTLKDDNESYYEIHRQLSTENKALSETIDDLQKNLMARCRMSPKAIEQKTLNYGKR